MDNSIDKLISKKIENIENGKNIFGTGKITKVMDFIVEAVGLDDCFFYEKIRVGQSSIGYVTKLDTNKVIISLLLKVGTISIGDMVYSTGEELKGEFSLESTGKIVDLFGNDKLLNKKFTNTVSIPIEHEIVPIMDRTSVNRPLETGIAGIDLIYPIGRGQRQLIIGDKKTGKTQIALDTIVNQAGKGMFCIYVALGKTKKEIKEIYYELLKRKATDYTVMITAFYDDVPPLLYLTPYFATSVADYYMKNGYDVLVIIDDLKKHADAYREISLLSGKSPGRDAYPADIFYSHSRMLESGCQYKNGASVTILPIVETKAGVITDYISTNIISITDGQIVLSAKNFQKGQKPAINYGLSVSRLGGAVQTPEMKKIGTKVKQLLLSYLETRDIYELANTDEMSKELQTKLFEGKKILDSLNQPKFSPLSSLEIRKRFDPNAKEEVIEKKDNKNQLPPAPSLTPSAGTTSLAGANPQVNATQAAPSQVSAAKPAAPTAPSAGSATAKPQTAVTSAPQAMAPSQASAPKPAAPASTVAGSATAKPQTAVTSAPQAMAPSQASAAKPAAPTAPSATSKPASQNVGVK